MQQTKTYKLNLMETSDTFSPDPLNQNTQMIEDALSAETAQRAADTAALDSRVTTLEAHKVAVGTYIGNGAASGQVINLGFSPRVVFVQQNNSAAAIATKLCTYNDTIIITENGFRAAPSTASGYNMNFQNIPYYYCAIL